MLTTLLKIALLPALVAAQIYGPLPGSPSTGSTTSAALTPAPTAPADTPGHMNIDVAFQDTFVFHPASIVAPIGTIVTFWFPNNGLAHSVTQSSFANPCTYLAASGNDSAGFDSGLQTNVQFSINITDNTKPIWFHCKQIDHCGMGMVGSINAPTSGSNTFTAFQNAAMAIGSNEVTETDNGPVLGGEGGASASATPASGAATAGGDGGASAATQPASGTATLSGGGGASAVAQPASSGTATSGSIKITASTVAIVMGVAIALWA